MYGSVIAVVSKGIVDVDGWLNVWQRNVDSGRMEFDKWVPCWPVSFASALPPTSPSLSLLQLLSGQFNAKFGFNLIVFGFFLFPGWFQCWSKSNRTPHNLVAADWRRFLLDGLFCHRSVDGAAVSIHFLSTHSTNVRNNWHEQSSLNWL